MNEMREDRKYQRCVKCVMDTTDPDIEFDDDGICSHCHYFENVILPRWHQSNSEGLRELAARIRRTGHGKEYDCVIGLSGGVDSSYVALLASELGLRPLAVHVGAGWNSELAVNNIENVVNKLGLDLHTQVIDWEEMRDLQLAFLRSGVANLDIPQDHAFAAAVYNTAAQWGIKHILSGSNFSTESILPKAWGYNAMDGRHLSAVHKKFGNARLRTYPRLSFWRYYIFLPLIRGIHVACPLNLIDYDKERAIGELEQKLGWRRYGGKHYESRFTRFYQSYLLPKRFGYDKRLAHFSSLILSGQMTREAALEELSKPVYDPDTVREDRLLFCKKLGISEADLDSFIQRPLTPYSAYPNTERWLQTATKFRKWRDVVLNLRR